MSRASADPVEEVAPVCHLGGRAKAVARREAGTDLRDEGTAPTLEIMLKSLLIAALSLAVCSCGPAHESSRAKNKNTPSSEKATVPSGSASITADPNPVPPGGELGETTIAWNAGSNKSGEIYVSKNGGEEKLFATGPSGAEKVKWISTHQRFEFRLYEGTAHSKMLAKVQVLHK